MRTYWCVVAVAACCVLAFGVRADEDGASAWADDLKLTVFGGNPPGRVTITINGEFAAEFDREPPVMTDVGDLMRAGENVMTVELEGDGSGVPGRNVQLAIAPVRNLTERQLESGRPLVHVTLPANLEPGAGCSQDVRFWTGPEAKPSADLKEAYWLVFQGPPTSHMVAVRVNGTVLVEAMEGDMFFDITPHVVRGKNEVEYDVSRTCLSRPTELEDALEIYFVAGEEKPEIVNFTGQPQAMFLIRPEEKKDAFVRRFSFRAR